MQLSTLLLMFAVLLLPLLPLFRAWTLWLGIEGHLAAGMRKALFTVGIASISVACLGWICFSVATALRASGWFSNLNAFFAWIHAGFCVAAAGFVFSLFGKGRSRRFSLVSATLITILWFLVGAIPY
jgi:hypothetical protein